MQHTAHVDHADRIPRTASRAAGSRALVGLSLLVVLLATWATFAGLFWPAGDLAVATALTSRGDTVELYGRGLYRFDPVFQGALFVAQDLVTLVLGVPVLLVALYLERRGGPRGPLYLSAILGYFLYVYASMALSAAYNELFLIYVALFSASLFALHLAWREGQRRSVPALALADPPRIGPAVFLLVAGGVTLFVWAAPLIAALLAGTAPPRLESTTKVTEALDLAIIVPLCFLAGALILRRRPVGYLLATPLLGLIVMLVPVMAAGTVSQIQAGVAFTVPEIVGPIGGFLVLGVLAVWVLVAVLRSMPATDHLEQIR